MKKMGLALLTSLAIIIQPFGVNAQTTIGEDDVKMKVKPNENPYSLTVIGDNKSAEYDEEGLKYKDAVKKIIISDLSGSGKGWDLTVQGTQLKNEDYTFPQGTVSLSTSYLQEIEDDVELPHLESVVVDDGTVEIIKAKEESGAGVVEIPLNKGEIAVPKGFYDAEDGIYETTLTWQLRGDNGEILFETESDYQLEIEADKIRKVHSTSNNEDDDEVSDVKLDSEGEPLPPTSTNIFNMLLIGFIVAGVGLVVLLFSREDKEKK